MTRRVIAAAATFALLSGVFIFNASAKMPDFEVYWRAGARALVAEPLYRAEDGHYQFKYLPAFAVLAIPVALLPLIVAKGIWFATSAVLVPAVLVLSLGLLPTRHRPAAALIAITLIAMAKFYGHELVLGQVNLIFAAVLLLAVHAVVRGASIRAGLLIALAVVIKPYALIVLPWLAGRRQLRALAAALAGILGALLAPVLVYGLDGTLALHRAWWRTVTESTGPNLLNADNVSLAGMYTKWFGQTAAATWSTIGTSLALLGATVAVVWLGRRIPAAEGLEASLLLTLIPLLSPQGWDYVFLVSTPAVLYLVNYDRALPLALRVLTWGALAIIAFSLYDVIGRHAYAVFMAFSVITVCYLVVVAALVALRVRRIA